MEMNFSDYSDREEEEECDPTEELREELIALADKGLIAKTSTQIKHMKLPALSKLKQSYLTSQTESVSDMLCKTAIRGVSKVFENYNLVDSADEMYEEQAGNDLFVGEAKSLLTNIVGYVPYIGIGVGAVIVYTQLRKTRNIEVSVNIDKDE